MKRQIGEFVSNGRGRVTLGGEPLVFHCNHYNYFLQSTLLLDPSLGMDAVIRDAATEVVSSCLRGLGGERRRERAEALFAELGFGTIDLSGVTAAGGVVRTPTSHYGQAVVAANEGKHFTHAQNLFDQGFAAAAAAWLFDLPAGAFDARAEKCLSQGAEVGEISLSRCASPRAIATSPGLGPADATPVPPRRVASNIDESGVLAALATLDFSGNEEGLIPRFGVMLTRHFANFYNRISFEFLRRMAGSGMEEEGRTLLVEAGHRCAFNTFGGIMTSAEWDAVVKPQCRTTEDWVHGMAAVVNALGWGTWRVAHLDSARLSMEAWDDYESMGFVGMYGSSSTPVSFLMAGGVAGLMNLVYPGQIASRPTLDMKFYGVVFESPERFTPSQQGSRARGDACTRVDASRER